MENVMCGDWHESGVLVKQDAKSQKHEYDFEMNWIRREKKK